MKCLIQLQFSPVIAGKWDFAPLPGIVDENGDINNSGSASGSAIVMMKMQEIRKRMGLYALVGFPRNTKFIRK